MCPRVTTYISYLSESLSDVFTLRLSQTHNKPIMFTTPGSLQSELHENSENAYLSGCKPTDSTLFTITPVKDKPAVNSETQIKTVLKLRRN